MRPEPLAAAPELPTSTLDLSSGTVEYRLRRGGPDAVVVLHGGHLRAGIALGEEELARGGRTVLVPSRPGYGRTAPAAGRTPEAFADTAAELCRRLGVRRVAAAVGVSAGGPTAVALAARHPDLVRRLVLVSAVGPLPWPEPAVRRMGRLAFAPRVEAATWASVRGMLRANPVAGLRSMMEGLSTEPAADVVDRLPRAHRAALTGLFCRMRSGHGFLIDLRALEKGGGNAALVAQPSLVVASRRDGAVPFAHAEALAAALGDARLLESSADGHLLWFSPDRPRIAAEIDAFIGAG
ncbi:alpha/beta fold hydrolase [Nocardiopsis composta]|uniref:Pimeloyl-ACP methyl ester carboxylesterase n=3 Tax=Nocardiopsis composta TaxID=157465 RepID=A0A7W8QHJ7_9ACTN|nr:alpha/beta fold hydrolase [Nocardiopsis composta]MBB5430154.1 pimeloyl-ACP methyl ester carboxylesterase [Nocardiopsis composta]